MNLNSNYSFCILIPTYMRNESLFRLLRSIIKFQNKGLKPFIIICDNNPKNNISNELEELLGHGHLYIKNNINLGACENMIKLLREFEELSPAIDYAMIMSDDDYFIKNYSNFLLKKGKATHDMYILNSLKMRENESKASLTFVMLSMRFLYSKARIIEHIRVLSGCVLSRGLVKKYLEIVDNSKIVRSEMYPMLVWSIISDKTKYLNDATIVHIVENTMHWGEYNHCKVFIRDRFLTFQTLSLLLPKKSIIIRKIIKIFAIRILKNKEKYPCIKEVKIEKYGFFETFFEKIISNFSFYLSRITSKAVAFYEKNI
jgi:hypothetical protein